MRVYYQLSLSAAFILAANIAAFAQDKGAEPEAAFNTACRTCHSVKAGDNRLGPHLNGIVGRKAGSAEGFAYSESIKKSGLVWDEATIDKFITNPDTVAPGNNMKPFPGVTDAGLRGKIIEYLKMAGAK